MLFPIIMCASFSHTIKRPLVPYDLGLRLIHTPESFLLLHPEANYLSLYHIDSSEPPNFARESNYSSIFFKFHHGHDELSGMMLTNRRDESNIAVLRKNKPICTMRMSVTHDHTSGHELRFDGQLHGQNELWNQQLKIIIMGLVLESICFFVIADGRICIGQTTGKDFGGASLATEDPNLSAYRARVLKLPLCV